MTLPLDLPDPAHAPQKAWITEPGIHLDLDDVTYHSDPVVGGSLSSTGARTLATRTAAHFDWERRHGRPDKREFDFGRAAHGRVLKRGSDIAVIVGTGKDKNAWRTDADKAAVAKARAAGKTPIRHRDNQVINDMAAALRDHKTAGPLLARPGIHESVWIWRDPITGIWCRLMADFMPDVPAGARRLIVDYKTSRDASPDGFARAIDDRGYDQQGDHYEDGVNTLDPREQPAQFVLVAQEKDPPYLVTVHYLDEQARARGRHRNELARRLYRDCMASGSWPGYPEDPIETGLPAYSARRFEAEQDAALYADDDEPSTNDSGDTAA